MDRHSPPVSRRADNTLAASLEAYIRRQRCPEGTAAQRTRGEPRHYLKSGTIDRPPTTDGVIGRPACRSLEILGAALQADGGTRSAFAASSIRRRSAAWTILPD